MKKFIFITLTLLNTLVYSEELLLNQYDFNGVMNEQELNNIVDNVTSQSADRIIITYSGPMVLLANNINQYLKQKISCPIDMQNLNVNGGYTSYNVLVSVYGGNSYTQQPVTKPTPKQNSFYDYQTPDSGFYDYDSN